MLRAFYSVIQYVPDPFRAEAVNLGLVLFCPELPEMRFRVSTNYDRAKRLFDASDYELICLKLSMQSMCARLELLAKTLKTVGELATFAASRGNDIRLTEPRFTKLKSIDTDFEELFTQLVSS